MSDRITEALNLLVDPHTSVGDRMISVARVRAELDRLHAAHGEPGEWQWALRWDDGEIEPRDDERDARRTHQRYTHTTVIRREVRYGPWIDDENGDTP